MIHTGIHDWRRFAAVSALVLAIVGLYWPAFVSLAEAWRDTERLTYTHGYLVAAVSAWLLWRARSLLSRPEQSPVSLPALAMRGLLLLALVLAWQIAYRAGIQLAQQVLLPPLFVATIYLVLGPGAARAASLPIAYLYFAIPVWDYFNFAALWSTTHAVRVLLMATGVPAYFEGNSVQVPAGQFEIAGGCSGMHYLVVALALATLIGELRRDRWPMRVRWWLIALVLAAVCNWVRVYVVILAGHLTHMQHYLVRESHYGFGWVLFALVIIALILIDRRTPLASSREGGAPFPSPEAPPESGQRWLAFAGMATLALVLPSALNQLIDARSAAPISGDVRTIGGNIDRNMGDCAPAPVELRQWQPRQRAADGEIRQAWRCGDGVVETYIAWYRDQRQGKKLGGYDNRLQGEAEVIDRAIETAESRRFQALHVRREGHDELMWLAYRVGDREFTSATRAQLWYSLQTLRTLRSPVSVAMAARASCEPDCAVAQEILTRFTQNGGIP
jgi:EpsI family protein